MPRFSETYSYEATVQQFYIVPKRMLIDPKNCVTCQQLLSIWPPTKYDLNTAMCSLPKHDTLFKYLYLSFQSSPINADSQCSSRRVQLEVDLIPGTQTDTYFRISVIDRVNLAVSAVIHLITSDKLGN